VKLMEISRDGAMARWPRLTAHLIAESLGYHTPKSAANHIASVKQGQTFPCEWVVACFYRGIGETGYKDELDASWGPIRKAIANRHYHTGFMASYAKALALVRAQVANRDWEGPLLASWF